MTAIERFPFFAVNSSLPKDSDEKLSSDIG
jgi:hypothetical protein